MVRLARTGTYLPGARQDRRRWQPCKSNCVDPMRRSRTAIWCRLAASGEKLLRQREAIRTNRLRHAHNNLGTFADPATSAGRGPTSRCRLLGPGDAERANFAMRWAGRATTTTQRQLRMYSSRSRTADARLLLARCSWLGADAGRDSASAKATAAPDPAVREAAAAMLRQIGNAR
jgi:hypothetical protein